MWGNGQLESFHASRIRMVEEQLRRRGIRDERVLAAMSTVPRHEFIDPRYGQDSYSDHPVPIPAGQTISQPYIVAAMIEALQVAPENLVLEVGTGTGYQAAILSRLARYVITIERHAVLAEEARRILDRLEYRNIEVVVADGSEGLPHRAPFDRIIVAAAAPEVPRPLFQQLSEGGIMIVPVGNSESQVLQLIRKQQGQGVSRDLDACRFVPLLGTSGFREDQ